MTIEKIKQDAAQEQKRLQQIVADTVAKLESKVDSADVSMRKGMGISVSTRQGETENVEFNNDGALAITVYQDYRTGSATTNDLSPLAIEQAVEMALNIMKYTSPDPYSGLGDKELMAFTSPDLDLFYPSDLNVDMAIKQAQTAERAAQSVAGIKNSDNAHFSSSFSIRVYGNSYGMLQSYCGSSHSLSCTVIGEQDGQMERDYAYTVARDIKQLSSADWVGQEAAKKTLAHLGARQIKTMKVPVLFAPEVATGLFGHFAGAISGSAIYKKSSFLLDKLGQPIFPEWLTIVERPHILKGLASSPFDADGIKTVERDIVVDGALQTYLLSSYSARKLSTANERLTSTGHASGIHNWQIQAKTHTHRFDELLKMLDCGILVTSLMGQGVNGITGDYSRGASGFWVENGQIQYPINEFTIASNLLTMYSGIVAIGSDVEKRTNIQSGSVLIDQMSIAGK